MLAPLLISVAAPAHSGAGTPFPATFGRGIPNFPFTTDEQVLFECVEKNTKAAHASAQHRSKGFSKAKAALYGVLVLARNLGAHTTRIKATRMWRASI